MPSARQSTFDYGLPVRGTPVACPMRKASAQPDSGHGSVLSMAPPCPYADSRIMLAYWIVSPGC
jgi:hypothetical protein